MKGLSAREWRDAVGELCYIAGWFVLTYLCVVILVVGTTIGRLAWVFRGWKCKNIR